MKFLKESDQDVSDIIAKEKSRQENNVELIASENFVSRAVLEAQGSILTNKYAEGYPGKRYYSGCFAVDEVEEVAISRAKKLFDCEYANVQPHSGSQANQAVYLALLNPGDTVLGMSLNSGGHLTHGAFPNLSGKWFNAISYDVNKDTYLIDYDEVESLAIKHKPKMIIAGYSCYSRHIDFKKFREIADKVGAYLLADIAHISGLVAAGIHQSPVEYAHIITSTTHKTLRGPRGGLVLSNDPEIGKKINKALFPGLQGGPLMHVIAAKAVAFKEAATSEFKDYSLQVVKNAQIFAKTLIDRGYDILTKGTDNHIIILNLKPQNITGKFFADSLDRAYITVNKNAIPFDETSPFITSGIRFGTPACTTRGYKEKEFILIANMIADLLDITVKNVDLVNDVEKEIIQKILKLNKNFPLYSDL